MKENLSIVKREVAELRNDHNQLRSEFDARTPSHTENNIAHKILNTTLTKQTSEISELKAQLTLQINNSIQVKEIVDEMKKDWKEMCKDMSFKYEGMMEKLSNFNIQQRESKSSKEGVKMTLRVIYDILKLIISILAIYFTIMKAQGK